MNTAKKWLAALLACLMLFSLVACVNNGNENEETTTSDLTDPLDTSDGSNVQDGDDQSPEWGGEELEMPEIPF